MELPKRVKVGPFWIEVVYPYRFTERGDLCAQFQSGTQRILVNDVDQGGNIHAPAYVWQAFMHEVIEAMEWVYVIGAFPRAQADEVEREGRIDRMAMAWLALHKDNPLLLSGDWFS